MPEIVPEKIEKYALEHSKAPGALFDELAEATRKRMKNPGMMSGPTVGLFLNTLVYATGARRVLEVGTFTGYSALMMASALPADGKLITCDVDPEATEIAKSVWVRSPHGNKIDLRIGPALETMRGLTPGFDFVFIDADKENYTNYYQRAMELLTPRGLIVVDNVLWGGAVLSPKTESDVAIAALADAVTADARVSNVLLTVRDGLMLIRRAG